MAFLYFQDEDHFLERKKNKGFFRFDDATSVDVVKEHMGKKNAFCIATPRTKYYIVSESRCGSHWNPILSMRVVVYVAISYQGPLLLFPRYNSPSNEQVLLQKIPVWGEKKQ